MATQYFRITAYHPTEDLSAIFDSNGKFEKLWQFSSFLIEKGFKIIEVASDEKFFDVNIVKADPDPNKLILRANHRGEPTYTTHNIDCITYKAISVGDKTYIPDKSQTI